MLYEACMSLLRYKFNLEGVCKLRTLVYRHVYCNNNRVAHKGACFAKLAIINLYKTISINIFYRIFQFFPYIAQSYFSQFIIVKNTCKIVGNRNAFYIKSSYKKVISNYSSLMA